MANIKINESVLRKALRDSIRDFVNEDECAMGGASSAAISSNAQFVQPLSKGVMRRGFDFFAGNKQKTWHDTDDEDDRVVNKRSRKRCRRR